MADLCSFFFQVNIMESCVRKTRCYVYIIFIGHCISKAAQLFLVKIYVRSCPGSNRIIMEYYITRYRDMYN